MFYYTVIDNFGFIGAFSELKLAEEVVNKYSNIPVLLNMKPHGKNMMYHLHKIGGMKHFIKDLIEQNIINGDILTITGKSLKETLN